MVIRQLFTALALLCLAGCGVSQGPRASGPASVRPGDAPPQFAAVAARIEPVAEKVCRDRGPVRDCDFQILLDSRPGLPANAFQTVDRRGRPLLIVTEPLYLNMANGDELAFVLGHEAAHHILGHLEATQQSAVWAAVLVGSVVAAGGADAASVEAAQRLGAQVGARVFSQEFELQADALGTLISSQAGFDPVRGAEYFARIPDPGDRFLGTHPPNAQRQATVARVAGELGLPVGAP